MATSGLSGIPQFQIPSLFQFQVSGLGQFTPEQIKNLREYLSRDIHDILVNKYAKTYTRYTDPSVFSILVNNYVPNWQKVNTLLLSHDTLVGADGIATFWSNANNRDAIKSLVTNKSRIDVLVNNYDALVGADGIAPFWAIANNRNTIKGLVANKSKIDFVITDGYLILNAIAESTRGSSINVNKIKFLFTTGHDFLNRFAPHSNTLFNLTIGVVNYKDTVKAQLSDVRSKSVAISDNLTTAESYLNNIFKNYPNLLNNKIKALNDKINDFSNYFSTLNQRISNLKTQLNGKINDFRDTIKSLKNTIIATSETDRTHGVSVASRKGLFDIPNPTVISAGAWINATIPVVNFGIKIPPSDIKLFDILCPAVGAIINDLNNAVLDINIDLYSIAGYFKLIKEIIYNFVHSERLNFEFEAGDKDYHIKIVYVGRSITADVLSFIIPFFSLRLRVGFYVLGLACHALHSFIEKRLEEAIYKVRDKVEALSLTNFDILNTLVNEVTNKINYTFVNLKDINLTTLELIEYMSDKYTTSLKPLLDNSKGLFTTLKALSTYSSFMLG